MLTKYKVEHPRQVLFWNTHGKPLDGYWEDSDDFMYVTDDEYEAYNVAALVGGVAIEMSVLEDAI